MSLKLFEQFGFILDKETATQYNGNCIFCGAEKHFFIHKTRYLWDCKKCGRTGNTKTLIAQVIPEACKNFKGDIATALATKKSLQIKILRKYEIGYLQNRYIVPFFDEDNNACTLQFYSIKNNRLINLHDTPIALFKCRAAGYSDEVWLCEGAWDVMALDEMLSNNAVIYGVTGAGSFKADWVNKFKDKKVNVVFDNDDAGEKGQTRIYKMLKDVVRSIRFIKWPAGLKKGFDIRDSLIEKYTIDDIRDLLQEMPKELPVEIKRSTGKQIACTEVYAAYKNWLHLSSTDIIDVVFGSIIANRLDGDPIWMFLVAPPGGTKTEFIMSLSDCPEIFALSSLTPHSLISGFSVAGADPSLIPKLNGKILAIKDFTNILNMNQTARDEIFGILRDAYDGECAKPFGNNQYKFYKSKFGIIAGVTPVIDQLGESQSALGERFLRYRIPIDTSIKGSRAYLQKAVSNVGKETDMRDTLKKMAFTILNYDYRELPEIDCNLQEKILLLAQFVGIMRGTVIRDKYSKEILHKPFTELGTRLTKQLTKIMYGICLFKGLKKATEKEFSVVKDVAKSSIPSSLEIIIKFIYKSKNTFGTAEISKKLNLPKITSLRFLENLNVLGALDRVEIGGGLGKYEWRISEDMQELLKGCSLYDN